ncbi:hypothetical protein A3Q56_01908 [Intoshia linei]|uniref:Cwf19-like C-terminal domain-containing protein n=1 Tax=Intoshia linei TaxID=1819745 RepID=A0A177B7Y3_9BILA|nr:hypothetical protein A3Q56_01908 [Intoshia linei]
MSKHLKILAIGEVDGNILKAVKKINKINEKTGPFQMALCVGSFFSENCDFDEYVKSTTEACIPIYILGPNKPEEINYYGEKLNYSGEITTNIFFLGKSGIYATPGGINIAYVSGHNTFSNNKTLMVNYMDIDNILNTINPESFIDVLITSCWPKCITKKCNIDESQIQPSIEKCSLVLKEILKNIQPSYVFTSYDNIYFKRTPYRNYKNEKLSSITKFISLAKFFNDEKFKSTFAIAIIPMKHRNAINPDSITDSGPNPFDETISFQVKVNETNQLNDVKINMENYSEKRLHVRKDSTCYIALPKGEYIRENLMIIPYTHIHSIEYLNFISMNEISYYCKIIRGIYNDEFDCNVLFYQNNILSHHVFVNALPIKKSISVDLIKDAFISELTKKNITYITRTIEMDIFDGEVYKKKNYVHIRFPDNSEMCFESKSLPIQFVKIILSSVNLLNNADKIKWQDHIIPLDKRKLLIEEFMEYIMRYDIINFEIEKHLRNFIHYKRIIYNPEMSKHIYLKNKSMHDFRDECLYCLKNKKYKAVDIIYIDDEIYAKINSNSSQSFNFDIIMIDHYKTFFDIEIYTKIVHKAEKILNIVLDNISSLFCSNSTEITTLKKENFVCIFSNVDKLMDYTRAFHSIISVFPIFSDSVVNFFEKFPRINEYLTLSEISTKNTLSLSKLSLMLGYPNLKKCKETIIFNCNSDNLWSFVYNYQNHIKSDCHTKNVHPIKKYDNILTILRDIVKPEDV